MQYAGEVKVKILTAPGQPEILVARSSFGNPRTVFVDQLVERLFGKQDDETPHTWEIIEEPLPENSVRIVIPVNDDKSSEDQK